MNPLPPALAALQRYGCVAIIEDGEPFAEFYFEDDGRWVQFEHVATAWQEQAQGELEIERGKRIGESRCVNSTGVSTEPAANFGAPDTAGFTLIADDPPEMLMAEIAQIVPSMTIDGQQCLGISGAIEAYSMILDAFPPHPSPDTTNWREALRELVDALEMMAAKDAYHAQFGASEWPSFIPTIIEKQFERARTLLEGDK